jgi:nucleoside-diphosphate-sugar epimerase
MKINVFGGTGFIGSNFCSQYPDDVIIQERENNIPQTDNILYLISTTDNYNVLTDIHKDVDVNLTKFLNVIQHCKGKTFNFISSWFVYGQINELPAKETDVCNPKGFYSITKKCAEDLLVSYCRTFNINYRILRLCNVYGKNDKNFSKKKNALQYLINEIQQNRNIDLYEGGNFIRDYMHVDDISKAIKLCIDKAPLNEIINVGSGIPQNFKEMIDFVIKETNSTSKINPIPTPAFHKIIQVQNMYVDVAKLKNLGYKRKINIFDGIKALL